MGLLIVTFLAFTVAVLAQQDLRRRRRVRRSCRTPGNASISFAVRPPEPPEPPHHPPPPGAPAWRPPGSQVQHDDPPVRVVRLLLFLLFPPWTFAVLVIWVLSSLARLISAAIVLLEIAVDLVGLVVAVIADLVSGRAAEGGRMSYYGKQVASGFERFFTRLISPLLLLANLVGVGGLARRITLQWRESQGMVSPRMPGDVTAGEDFPPPPPPMAPFAGRYEVLEQIPGGGSSAELFVVRRLEGGVAAGGKLLLKSFDLTRGAGLDSLVRESEGMRLAKRVGIVTDYMFGDDYFYYVMPFYEGETLTQAVGRQFRHVPGGTGLDAAALREVLGWVRTVALEVSGYHEAGLIHKDIKPENVILTSSGPRLVDVGLVTQLSSAMTLTTHGTEYFRDPELVRQAMAGTKVNEIAAERFDVYSLGALLYFAVQGTFPATGRFSRYERLVPYAVAAIANKAMSDFDKRHASAASLLEDLDALLAAGDLDEVQPARLPSFREEDVTASEQSGVPEPHRPAAVAERITRRRRGSGRPLALVVTLAMIVGVGVFGLLTLTPYEMSRLDGRSTPVEDVALAPELLNESPRPVRVDMRHAAVVSLRRELASRAATPDAFDHPVLLWGDVFSGLASDPASTGALVELEDIATVDVGTARELATAIDLGEDAALAEASRRASRLLGAAAPVVVIATPGPDQGVRLAAYLDGERSELHLARSALAPGFWSRTR